MTIYPWQLPQWREITGRRERDALPHALLFAGPSGLGKGDFSRLLAKSLLCEAPGSEFMPCGQCKSCLLYAAGNHPDLTIVSPDEGKSSIAIAKIREMTQSLLLTGQYGRYRIAIVEPAEQLNTSSANSLLKTLEEPGEATLIMLITHEPHKLLPTIRSRCQRVNFSVVDRHEAIGWLRSRIDALYSAELLLDLAGNSPLHALALAENDVLALRRQLWQDMVQLMDGRGSLNAMAEALAKGGAKRVIEQIWTWLVDMVRFRSGEVSTRLLNPDMLEELKALSLRADLFRLLTMVEKLTNALRLADTQVNQQMLLEDVFITWKAVFTPGRI